MQLKIDTMKHLNLLILGGIVIILSIIFGVATLKVTGKYRFKRNATEMLVKVTTQSQYLDMSRVKELVRNDTVAIIDIRTPKEFAGFHIEEAQNIPFDRLLDDEFIEILESNQMKILYGSNSVGANAAWMVLTQYGYDKIYVLDGGVQDWITQVETRDIFKDAYKNDETPVYSYSEVMNPENE
jgi:rhodanese-related sulfurtransferase